MSTREDLLEAEASAHLKTIAELQTSEAGAAALREALEKSPDALCGFCIDRCKGRPQEGCVAGCFEYAQFKWNALATDAGKAFQERLEKAEAEAQEEIRTLRAAMVELELLGQKETADLREQLELSQARGAASTALLTALQQALEENDQKRMCDVASKAAGAAGPNQPPSFCSNAGTADEDACWDNGCDVCQQERQAEVKP